MVDLGPRLRRAVIRPRVSASRHTQSSREQHDCKIPLSLLDIGSAAIQVSGLHLWTRGRFVKPSKWIVNLLSVVRPGSRGRFLWRAQFPLSLCCSWPMRWAAATGKPADNVAPSPSPVTVARPLEKTITEWDEYTGRFTPWKRSRCAPGCPALLIPFISRRARSLNRVICSCDRSAPLYICGRAGQSRCGTREGKARDCIA